MLARAAYRVVCIQAQLIMADLATASAKIGGVRPTVTSIVRLPVVRL